MIKTTKTADNKEIFVESAPSGRGWQVANDYQWFSRFDKQEDALLALEACTFFPERDVKKVCSWAKKEIRRSAANAPFSRPQNDGHSHRVNREFNIIENVVYRLEGKRPIVTKATERWV